MSRGLTAWRPTPRAASPRDTNHVTPAACNCSMLIRTVGQEAARAANRNFTWKEWKQYFPDTPYRRTIQTCDWPLDLPPGERATAEAEEASKS